MAPALLGDDVGEEMDLEAFKEGYIPEHSYILGAWVSAGILGAVFWFWVFILVVRALSRSIPRACHCFPLRHLPDLRRFGTVVFPLRVGNANHHSILRCPSHDLHDYGVARLGKRDCWFGAQTAERFQGCCAAGEHGGILCKDFLEPRTRA